jgi:Sec-independent protein translocase protein TatA
VSALGLLDVGPIEMLVLAIAAIMLFGGDLPDIARRAGQFMGRLRAAANELTRQFDAPPDLQHLPEPDSALHRPPPAQLPGSPASSAEPVPPASLADASLAPPPPVPPPPALPPEQPPPPPL